MSVKQGILRLKVCVTSAVKFYIRINGNARLNELKQMIDDILNSKFQYRMPDFTVKSEDGFEVLDEFLVGEVLVQDQIIKIEPNLFKLTSKGNHCTKTSPRISESQAKEVPIIHIKESDIGNRNRTASTGKSSSSIEEFYKKKEDYLRMKNEKAQNTENQVKQRQKIMVSSIESEASEEVSPESAVPSVSKNNTDETANAINSTNDKESPPEADQIRKSTKLLPPREAINSNTSESANPDGYFGLDSDSSKDASIFPSGFKGFVVKKKDIHGSKFTPGTESQVFKPLKRKKDDEKMDPLDL